MKAPSREHRIAVRYHHVCEENASKICCRDTYSVSSLLSLTNVYISGSPNGLFERCGLPACSAGSPEDQKLSIPASRGDEACRKGNLDFDHQSLIAEALEVQILSQYMKATKAGGKDPPTTAPPLPAPA